VVLTGKKIGCKLFAFDLQLTYFFQYFFGSKHEVTKVIKGELPLPASCCPVFVRRCRTMYAARPCDQFTN